MYKTGKEIFNQYEALKKTYKYLTNQQEEIRLYKDSIDFSSITYIGSGSSYALCQSAAISTRLHLGIPSYAIAAGDLMLSFNHYHEIIKDTLVIAPSRSGSTSEVIKSIKQTKEKYNRPCISISAKKDSLLSNVTDYNLELPWIFDESVCQTRTVTNLYTVNLYLIGLLAKKYDLLDDINKAVNNGEFFIDKYKDKLKKIGEKGNWEKVVVLADSELSGIAAEASIAFKEIPQIMSNYYHILDVRHGPMVMIDNKTLVILASTEEVKSYQKDLIDNIMEKGAKVITVGQQKEEYFNSDLHVELDKYKYYGVSGIPFIFVPQVIAYYKALKRDINPDFPKDLDPWIKL